MAQKLRLYPAFVDPRVLSEGWRYRITPDVEGRAARLFAPETDDAGWQPAIVPMIHRGAPDRNTIWYRIAFDPHATRGTGARLVLRFGGALLRSIVWLNGEEMGSHDEGFAPFGFDISSRVHGISRTVLVVRCTFPTVFPAADAAVACSGIYADGDNRPYPSRFRGQLPRRFEWPLPAGLWAPVELTRSGPIAVESLVVEGRIPGDTKPAGGGRVRGRAVARLHLRLRNLTPSSQPARINVEILDDHGERLATGEEGAIVPPGDPVDVLVEVGVPEPFAWFTWSLGQPRRYRCRVWVAEDAGAVSAQTEAWFGFRRLDVRLKEGRPVEWWLNGQALWPRGTRYTPDFWLDQVTERMAQLDLELARGAGLDLLCVTGYLAPRSIVQAAENAGILLLQQMPTSIDLLRAAGGLEQAVRLVQAGDALLGSSPAFAGWALSHDWEYLASRLAARARPESAPLLDLTPVPGRTFAVCAGSPSLPSAESPIWHSIEQRWPITADDPDWLHAGYSPDTWTEQGLSPIERFETLESAIEATQETQARRGAAQVLKWRQQAFRGNAGFVWGTLVDAFPGFGPSLLDYARLPKLAYHVTSNLLRPLAVLLEVLPDPASDVPGVHGVGDRFRARIHVVNERASIQGRATLTWTLQPSGWRYRFGKIRRIERRTLLEVPDRLSGARLVEELDIVLPLAWRGRHSLDVTVRRGLRQLARTTVRFQVGEGAESQRAAVLPGWLVGQRYRWGSLQASGDGFVFVLRSGWRKPRIEGILGLSVDGQPVPLSRVQIVAAGKVRAARDIAEEQPLVVPRGKPLTVWVEGVRLNPGEHRLEWSFRTRRLGSVKIRFRDYAA